MAEQSAISAILPLIPSKVSPDHLTYLGFAGAIVTGFSLAASSLSAAFLPLAVLGLLLNWFGDSFDGSLARFRSTERPRYGFLLDHSIDLVATTFILVGLGVSPYMPFDSACFALLTYLLFCGYVYIKVAADGVHRLDFCGFGATEFRIMVALWVLMVHALGLEAFVNQTTSHLGPYFTDVPVLDIATGLACCVACLGLFRVILRDAAMLRSAEPVPFVAGKVVELLKTEKRSA
ncbi:CDP-alcohol phosphatidyltransferase family protein [Bradyrhizobium sp. Ec3.3]|uniref:CDP-alcohol phosphatidyltransferase family protein n=1 Tax=Bradyrhizobium sp. Ec3.3 TaxID=189753 RepID=UPI0004233A21|nr:CDP-alcohol phosphatidyltransferase family protein [Bradyrhizobium sp. Ec3.3]